MKTENKVFLIGIILLGFNFLHRLINASKTIFQFPLDITNDLSAYTSLVHFYDLYGYMGLVPNWYNGFILFNTYPPGWVFFTYPLYKLLGHLMLAGYISMILIYLLGAISIHLIGKELNLSRLRQVLFFLLVFANPMLIGAVLKQGRIPSLMALVLFTYFVYFALLYKNRTLDWKIILMGLLFFVMLITHQAESVLTGIFLIGLLLVKDNKQRFWILSSLGFGLLLSLFWVIPFVKALMSTNFLSIGFANWVLDFNNYFWTNIAGILISIALIPVFYFYYRQNKGKKMLLFYLPVLIFNVFFLTRLVVFVPIVKYIYPDPYQDFFMFFLSLFFVSLDYSKLNLWIRRLFYFGFVLILLLGIGYNLVKTPYYQDYTQLENDFLEVISKVTERYVILVSEHYSTSYSRAYDAYSAIYLDKYSVSGWGDMYKERDYILYLKEISLKYIQDKDCSVFFDGFRKMNTTQFISTSGDCEILDKKCGLVPVYSKGKVCLFSVS